MKINEIMSRREMKIFLTVFLAMATFIQVYGVNANSHLDLTRSIVDHGTLNIDAVHNNTGDRSKYKGHYYSDKAPGLSLINVPLYFTWKNVYGLFGNTEIGKKPRKQLFKANNVSITAPEEPGDFYLSSLILMVLFSSTLPVAILSVLFYRIAGTILEDEVKKLLVTFGFSFGTLITHYGTDLFPDAMATLLAFSSFYLLYFWKDHPGKRKMIFAGLLGGIAVIVNTLTGIVLVFNAVYALWKYEKLPVYYTLGGFIGGLPFMIYNTLVFGAPWNLPRSYLDPVLWKNLQNNIGFRFGILRNAMVSFRILFMPYRGIFYWFPLLLLALLGYREFYGRERKTALIAAVILISSILMVSSWWAWWHGGWFGERHLVFIMPFFIFPVAYAVKEIDMKLLGALVTISVLVNLAGYHGGYEDSLKSLQNSSTMKESKQMQLYSLKPLGNPLKEYYVPGLAENGVNSQLFDGLYSGRMPDIRTYADSGQSSPLFLIIWYLILVPLAIWNREIRDILDSHRKILEDPS